jgi:hypothetical protein
VGRKSLRRRLPTGFLFFFTNYRTFYANVASAPSGVLGPSIAPMVIAVHRIQDGPVEFIAA